MTHSPMTPGEQLRTQREKLGLGLQDLASRTRIRRAYLEALEEDRQDIFPGETYRQGFLRIYAGALGLDPRDLAPSEPSPEPDDVSERAAAEAPVPASSRRMPLIALGLLVAMLAIGAVCWLLPSLDKADPSVTAGPAPEADSLAPPPSAPSEAPPRSRPAEPPASPSPGMESPQEGDSSEFSPGLIASQAPPDQSAEPTESSVEPVGETAEPFPAAEAATSGESSPDAEIRLLPPSGATLRVEATGGTGVELTLDGRPARRYDLKAGTQLSWKVRQSAHLRIDDPAAVRLRIDQQDIDLSGTSEMILSTALDAQ